MFLVACYDRQLYFTDEMRYGTRTACKRRWSRQGQRPVCQVRLGYEWGWLYVALNPFSGDLFARYYSQLNSDCFTQFMSDFKQHLEQLHPDGEPQVVLIGDKATAHTASKTTYPAGIDFEPLPTACPELNPVEHFFQQLRKDLSNQVFDNLQQVQECLDKSLKAWQNDPNRVTKLTLYPYLYKWSL